MDNIVTIKNLTIDYKMKTYDLRAVTNVDFNIERGKITALVGESGSGKTTLASAILGALTEPGEVVGGEIIFHGEEDINVVNLAGNNLQKFRWEQVSMVFQAAQSALNPVMKVFDQFYETAYDHGIKNKEEVRRIVTKYLEFVKLDPERVLRSYPHELSGGMKQRVMIAFAMMLNPKLIILDEPTTALDVITQDAIFKLLKKINKEFGVSMLLLTHDISVVAKYSDYVGVMYAGRIMEFGTTQKVFLEPESPYTKVLIASTPSLTKDISEMEKIESLPPELEEIKNSMYIFKTGKKGFKNE